MSHYGLNRFTMELEHLVPRYSNQQDLVNAIVHSMQKLLSNPQVLEKDFVAALTAGLIDGRVYTSPEHGFFVQIFAWPPKCETPVHDHNTWGVMGVLSNRLQVTEYQLYPKPDGSQHLEQKDRFLAEQGSIVCLTFPDDEIHHIMNPSDHLSLSVHVYGAELENTHVFDLENGQIRPA